MSSGEDTNSHELVIIRRRVGDGEEPHKGGVWKIAYADFMTAMMAFFLVMWLINATDKQTLIQVASYFNPLRLNDKIITTKGVHDLESGARGKADTSESSTEQGGKTSGDPKANAGNPKNTEEALFKDPYGILTKLAVQAARGHADDQTRSGAAAQRDSSEMQPKGQAYRDPFDPAFRRDTPNKRAEDGEALPKGDPRPAVALAETAAAGTPGKEAAPEAAEQADRAKLESEIKQALEQAALGVVPNVDVTITEEGVLISLTDRFDFGMFRLSSAEPRPELVVVMEKIAKIISLRPESLIIRGHTDGRPFKSGTYDNWRLSTARAHMAYYMLVRGGIAERRFERIQGHADRSLKIAGDPGAAQNRRIEILLRKATP